MTRKLASIKVVDTVIKHPNADNLDIVSINGWKCVTKHNEVASGDFVVYFEIDSVLPVRAEFEFLRKTSYVSRNWLPMGEGFRLKTIRLRGQISQGLVLPWRTFYADLLGYNDVYVGMDVTDILGVSKWDPPMPAQLAGVAKGNFPSFIPKTDQERVQNIGEDLVLNQGETFEVTEKLEGSSVTYYAYNGEFGVCSRNLELVRNEDNSLWATAAKLDIENKLLATGRNVAVQGELVGVGIQSNIYKLADVRFYAFDVYDIDRGGYLSPEMRIEFIGELDIPHVPVIEHMVMTETDIDFYLNKAQGVSQLNTTQEREGLVFKSPAMTFKAISNVYLEKNG